MSGVASPKAKKRKKPARQNWSAQADTLFSKLVRSRGYCQLARLDRIACNGNLQCMHLFSRRYRNTRWDFRNAICGCAAHHYWYTLHPIEWDDFMRAWLNAPFVAGYDELRALALSTEKVDPKEVLAGLKQIEGAG